MEDLPDQHRIVHLCLEADWQAAQIAGEYRAASLAQEGFIHCSRPAQIAEVARRFYRGVTGLVLLQIDTRRLAQELHWELSDGQIFPHLYGPLNLEAVVAVLPFSPDPPET